MGIYRMLKMTVFLTSTRIEGKRPKGNIEYVSNAMKVIEMQSQPWMSPVSKPELYLATKKACVVVLLPARTTF